MGPWVLINARWYKYLNGIPVEDLDREAIVLVHATEQAYDAGLNGETMAPFFKTQIDAAKAIQRCWIDRWKTGIATAPADAPNLQHEIRPRLIEIGDALIFAIVAATKADAETHPDPPPVLDCLPPAFAEAIVATHAGAIRSSRQGHFPTRAAPS